MKKVILVLALIVQASVSHAVVASVGTLLFFPPFESELTDCTEVFGKPVGSPHIYHGTPGRVSDAQCIFQWVLDDSQKEIIFSLQESGVLANIEYLNQQGQPVTHIEIPDDLVQKYGLKKIQDTLKNLNEISAERAGN